MLYVACIFFLAHGSLLVVCGYMLAVVGCVLLACVWRWLCVVCCVLTVVWCVPLVRRWSLLMIGVSLVWPCGVRCVMSVALVVVHCVVGSVCFVECDVNCCV